MMSRKNISAGTDADDAGTASSGGHSVWLKVKRCVNFAGLMFIPLFGIWYIELGWRFGLEMYKQVYTMVIVGVVQFLVYLNYPARKKGPHGGGVCPQCPGIYCLA